MVQERIKTLGEAKQIARKNAKRDGCEWWVWYTHYNESFTVAEAFAEKTYLWTKVVYKAKPISESEKNQDGLITLTVTPEQAQLIEWILEDENDRQVYPGTEESKVSLWKMLTGRKGK